VVQHLNIPESIPLEPVNKNALHQMLHVEHLQSHNVEHNHCLMANTPSGFQFGQEFTEARRLFMFFSRGSGMRGRAVRQDSP
jgi:hypothetical protein